MLTIQRMNREHLEAVAAIEADVFSTPWTKQGFADTLNMENVMFFVAVENGNVVGYCGIYFAADEGEITNVAVSSTYRRMGIADMLLKNLLKEATQKGAVRFILEVRCSNRPAIQLYKKFGFEIQGKRKDFYEKPKEDAYIMILDRS